MSDFKKSINSRRRKLMHRLTKNVGHLQTRQSSGLSDKAEIKKILICRPNHRLGNLLLITPLLQEVTNVFPGSKIDLFVKGNAASLIFKNYEHIGRIIQLPKKPFKHLIEYVWGWITIKRKRYDLVINPIPYSSSGKLSASLARAKYKIFGEVPDHSRSEYNDYEHVAKLPVYAFRNFLKEMGIQREKKEVPSLNLKLSLSEMEEGRKALMNIVHNEKETISLFTYATGEKCFSKSWWMEFYEKLKASYPDHNIIEILPVENVSNISFMAPSFYSRDIREIGSLIAQTELFVGADSGMMHLASSVHTPTVGLFSVTDQNAYQPYANKSLSVKVEDKNMEECFEAIKGIL